VLVVASSGIASLLLLGGRTAHSRFKILINLHDVSTCNITQEMKVAKLVHKADLIIWDEAPMMHCRTFETVDWTLRDLMQLDDAIGNREDFWWENRGPWWGFSTDPACCSQGRTRRHWQCFVASIASLVACFDFLSSYQHANHGSQF
jgi:hypothetical protein